MDDNKSVNAAILERLEKVVQSLQENSVKMGELLAVHNEKLDKQDRIDAVLFEKIEQVDQKLDRHATDIKKGCERDIMLVDNRLRTIEKKMWTIAGSAEAGDDPPVRKKKKKKNKKKYISLGRGARKSWMV